MKSSPKKPVLPAAPEAVQDDLLSEAASIQPPAGQGSAVKPMDFRADANNATTPEPAEDENQPGFIGERNVPHP